MRLASFAANGATHVGVVDGSSVVSLGLASAGDPRFRTMRHLVGAGAAALAEARELAESHPAHAAYDVDDVTLLAPLPDPPRVHGRPAGTRFATGPGELVSPAPDGGLAIGLVAVVDVDAGLFGATILAGAQGPVLVTDDELRLLGPDLPVEIRVNGATRCRTAFPQAVAGLERRVEATGPHRAGSLVVLDLPLLTASDTRPLRDGDEVQVEVAGLGLLRNRIQL
ncbi:fumarylacetoacetate hydrolase family protein [Nocardioides sp. R1-1]|uniref:fumarylacetoacetate hydrolase family protein n=1 Tax=Nocardioides sp. R1-1 TaxID=3383502 RepID=UPI0038D197A2